jgi:hypothetical protein
MTDFTEDDLKARLAAAHIRGDGKSVYEVWDKIASGQLSPEATQAWAKLAADWIVSTGKTGTRDQEWREVDGHRAAMGGHRAERVHVGLAISGFAESELDTLEDEYLLFQCATGRLKLRAASEQIWQLIAQGKATQGLREQWLDHISKQILDFIIRRNKREFYANRAPEKLPEALSLSRKKRHKWSVDQVEILYVSIISKFPQAFYSEDPRKYVSLVLEKLSAIGAINQADACDETLKRQLRELMLRHPPPESGG